jgi:hypothetical protein
MPSLKSNCSKELLKFTAGDEEEYMVLKEAEAKIGRVVAFVNSAKSRAEDLQSLESQFFQLLESLIISDVRCVAVYLLTL